MIQQGAFETVALFSRPKRLLQDIHRGSVSKEADNREDLSNSPVLLPCFCLFLHWLLQQRAENWGDREDCSMFMISVSISKVLSLSQMPSLRLY